MLVFATAAPAQATTLTSCYLARSDAALAVSRLVVDIHDEHLSQHLLAATEHHATLAGVCLLDHASALRELLAARTEGLVAVDIDPAALEQVAHAWAHRTDPLSATAGPHRWAGLNGGANQIWGWPLQRARCAARLGPHSTSK